MNRDCKHGQLARSCNICDLEAQIKEDEALLRQALGALAGWMDQPETTAAYDAAMDRANDAITALRERLGETK